MHKTKTDFHVSLGFHDSEKSVSTTKQGRVTPDENFSRASDIKVIGQVFQN